MMLNRTICMAVLLVCPAVFALDLHVAPDGKNANSGTKDAPLGSLSAARDAIRQMKAQAPLPAETITVWIHAGAYLLDNSFTLGQEDSGTSDGPIMYRAVSGEDVRLIGGKILPPEAFKNVTDDKILQRVDPAARDHVLCTDLRALGIGKWSEFPDAFSEPPLVPELFFNGQRMTLARWPNDDWTTVAKVVESGPAPWRHYASDQLPVFEYDGDRPTRWATAPAVWLHGYWCFDWSSETICVKNIDPEKHQITLVQPHCYGLGSGNPAARRYYAVNLLEELDAPGEYYLDGATGLLYFWPPAKIDPKSTVLSTLGSPAISMKDVSFVTLRGLTVETCEGTGIEMTGGRGNAIEACVVRNAGQNGIKIEGGEKHRVVACDIYDIGRAGLLISGGDRKTLTPCGHEAVNNHIYRVGRRQRTHAYNVHIGGVGVRVANNLLNDAPHQAIGLAGNDHIIEFNEIHHTGLESDDCGAFYMGRNPSERGTILRYNFWHDTGSSFAHGSCAIYFDDGSGGQTVFGNVFYRAAGGNFGAVFVHGGHDNTVANNIFIECKRAIGQVPWNDALWKEWLDGELWQRLLRKEVDITAPPYTERYPQLKGFLEFAGEPRFNYATRNIVYKCGDFIQGNWREQDNWVTETDPGFEDAARLNFQLKQDADLAKVPGFVRIPFDRIGLVRDELRPKLPSSR